MSQQIGSLSVKLGLVTVEWDQATAKAKAQAKDLQKSFNELGEGMKTLQGYWKTLGGGIGVASIGFATLLTQALSYSKEIRDLSDAYGISMAKTMQFRDALQRSGASAEGAAKIMSTLFTKIQQAKEGNEETITQFERMGVSFKELTTLSPEQAVNRVFQALSKIPDVYQRIKYSKDLLGKAGVGISAEEMSKNLGMSLEGYKKHEAEMEKLSRVADNLKTSMNNLTIAFTSIIAPFAREGLISVEKFKVALITMGSVAVVNGLMKVVEALKLIQGATIALNTTISASSAVGAMLAVIGYVYAMGAEQEEKIRQKAADTPTKRRYVYGTRQKDGTFGSGHWEDVKTTEEQKAIADNLEANKAARIQLDTLRQKIEDQKKSLAIQKEENAYALEAYKYSDNQNKQMSLAFEYRKQILALDQKEADIKKQYSKEDAMRKTALEGVQAEKQAAKDSYETKAKMAQQEEQQRQDFNYGWNQAFKKYSEDAQNYSKVGADAFKSVTGNMETAIVNFVTKGKISFKGLAQSIIADLIQIQAKMMASNLISGLFGGILSGAGGLLSSVMGSSSTDFLNAGASYSSIGLKASGGSISGGSPYIVGEQGPEMIIPGQSGVVVPNNQLSNSMGGGGITYNGPYIANMSAIDTQSATQFLAKNKTAVWAANQSAQRGLPTSK